MNFQHDYIEFDELGVKKIRCMNCETVVAERTTEPVTLRTDPPEQKWVERFTRLPNFRQIRVVLSDGSFIEPIVCADCESVDIDKDGQPDVAENLRAQIERAAVAEATNRGRSKAEIAEITATHKKFEVLKKIPNEAIKDSRQKAVLMAALHEKSKKEKANGKGGGK